MTRELPQRARSYLNAIPGAVSGAAGHAATFSAACVLVRFGLSQSEAWTLLLEYNARCLPPWPESDLKHKLTDAFRVARPDPRFIESQRGQGQEQVTPEQKRARWPKFETPTKLELHQIGELRNIGADGLALAVRRGLLRCADYFGARCWIVTDTTGYNAQARRLDGLPFGKRDGTSAKALTLPGSTASWPVGLNELEPFQSVMLCEGGPDLLAAHHFITVEERDFTCCSVAMLGASNRIPESALPKFAGKQVRIFPHCDIAGKQAAGRWAKALLTVTARADVFSLDGLRRVDEQPVKDLNDLCSIHADDFENDRELWNLCPA